MIVTQLNTGLSPALLPPVLKEVIQETANRFLEEARDSGQKLIGYTCSYVPEALLSVKGLVPVRMFAPGVVGTEMAETYLSNLTCSYTRSLLEYALEGRYEFLHGWIFTASCDHLRRLYDNLVYLTHPEFAYMLDLPHKTGAAACDWYEAELRDLAEKLSERFGVDTGAESLRAAIHHRNEYLALLRSIGELRREKFPRISGTEFHTLLRAGSVMPAAACLELFEQVRQKILQRAEFQHYRARVMVVGSELDDPEYLEILERGGALVVADRYCTGSFPGLEAIPETDDDPLRTLAHHKLRQTSCPRMMDEFASRVAEIIRIAREYHVDGIVIQTIKFCDIWGVESSPLVSALRDAKFPILRLEREYRLSGEGQLKTRIQAFLESMGR